MATPASNPHVQDQLAVWDKKTAIGKEILTGCIGLMIVGMTLFVALIAVLSARNATVFAAAKDVLIVVTGLVGVVLGCCFGRMPATPVPTGQAPAAAAQPASWTGRGHRPHDPRDRPRQSPAPTPAIPEALKCPDPPRGAGVSAAGGRLAKAGRGGVGRNAWR